MFAIGVRAMDGSARMECGVAGFQVVGFDWEIFIF